MYIGTYTVGVIALNLSNTFIGPTIAKTNQVIFEANRSACVRYIFLLIYYAQISKSVYFEQRKYTHKNTILKSNKKRYFVKHF